LITLIIAPLLSETAAQTCTNGNMTLWLRRLFSRATSFGSRMQTLELRFRGHLWIVVVLAVALWACMHHGRLNSTQLIHAYFDDKRFPVEASDYIAAHHIREPIFSLDYWGGYLIYRLYPETRVVFDDRHDLYGDQFIKDDLKVVLVQPTWQKELDQMHVDWVLVPRWSSLANIIRLSSNWIPVHEDGTAVLFHRLR
jgi:hypothetical protein